MSDPTITVATTEDRERVVHTTVEAFREDPAFRYFFPTRYDDQASAFAGRLFDSRVDGGAIWLADGGAGVAMWSRPNADGREDDIEQGLADVLEADAIERIVRYEHAVDHLLPDEAHWYLGILATDPVHRGRRLGRTAMRHGLIEAGREGRRSSLETTNPANVARYRAAGWTISDKVQVDQLQVWILVHDGLTDT